MKFLQDYMEAKQTKLFKDTGTFFAFSKSQFHEKKKDGLKYVPLDGGMVCPTTNVKLLVDGLEKIYRDGIKQDLKENGLRSIVIRELYNHECFYTYDYDRVFEVLEDYGITKEEISKIFHEEAKNAE